MASPSVVFRKEIHLRNRSIVYRGTAVVFFLCVFFLLGDLKPQKPYVESASTKRTVARFLDGIELADHLLKKACEVTAVVGVLPLAWLICQIISSDLTFFHRR